MCCETYSTWTSATCIYTPRSYFVNLLQKLRFSCWWISQKTDIYVSSNSALSILSDFLLSSSKQLRQYTFFDILTPKNRRSKALNKIINNRFFFSHFHEESFLLISEQSLIINSILVLFKDLEWYQIYVCTKKRSISAFDLINFGSTGSENTYDFNPITRSESIYVCIIG